MVGLTKDQALEKYVDKDDVKRFRAKHKKINKKLKRLKKKNLPKYEIHISRIKDRILQTKIDDETGTNVTLKGNAVEWQVVYGRARLGGAFTFVSSRSNNELLDAVVTIAGHEIDAIEKLYLDGEEVVFGGPGTIDSRWSSSILKADGTVVPALNNIFMSANSGHPNQGANGDLMGQLPNLWTSAHRQRGRAGAYIILVWNPLIFPDGLPEIEFLVRGAKVYDPRLSGGAGGYAWSDNPALCVADYLMNTEYGMRVPQSKIDMTQLTAAANRCDELQSLNSGEQEKLFTVNGVLNAADSPENILETLVGHMSGSLTYVGGKWKVYPAQWRTSVVTLDENDVLSEIAITTNPSRKDIFNRVRGTFTDPANAYRESDLPVVKNDFWKAEDGGEEIWEDVQLPLCTSAAMGQRIMKLELERTRAGMTITFLAKLKAFKAEPAETFTMNNTRLGWVGKTFEVLESELVIADDDAGFPRLAVAITAKETAQALYDLSNYESSYDVTPNTRLPNPWSIGHLTNLTLESGTDHLELLTNGTIVSRIKVSWTLPDDFFVTSGGEIYVEYKKSADSNYTRISPVPGDVTFAYIAGVKDGVLYDVRVRPRNAAGFYGNYVTRTNYRVVGKTEPPSNVVGFVGQVLSYGIKLTWTDVPDPDKGEYELRVGPVGATWNAGEFVTRTKATTYISELRFSGNYQFMLKAIDTSGNYSTTEAVVAVNVPVPAAPTTVLTLEEDFVIFSWLPPSSHFAIDSYEIRYAVVTEDQPVPTYGSSTLIASTKATIHRVKVQWVGTRYFWVAARDVAGNLGTPYLVTLTVNAPPAPGRLRGEVIDNNVLLFWDKVRGTLPLVKYLVFRGATFAGAVAKGEVGGTFIGLFETVAGTYTYWVVGEDSAGHRGTPAQVTLKVNQPPDFILRAEGVVDPRNARVGTNVFIENFGFLGGVAGGGGPGGTGSPIGVLVAVTIANQPIGGPGGTGSPIGVLAAVTES